jgi:hypothetical protein
VRVKVRWCRPRSIAHSACLRERVLSSFTFPILSLRSASPVDFRRERERERQGYLPFLHQ